MDNRVTGEKSILMAGETSRDGVGILQDSGIKREEVKTITFVDSLAKAPERALDVSEKKNRSVLVWAEGKAGEFDLYIAGNGKVVANQNCRFYLTLIQTWSRSKGWN